MMLAFETPYMFLFDYIDVALVYCQQSALLSLCTVKLSSKLTSGNVFIFIYIYIYMCKFLFEYKGVALMQVTSKTGPLPGNKVFNEFVCVCVRVYQCSLCICTYLYIYIYIYIHLHMYVHVHIYVYTYKCVYIYVYINTYLQKCTYM